MLKVTSWQGSASCSWSPYVTCSLLLCLPRWKRVTQSYGAHGSGAHGSQALSSGAHDSTAQSSEVLSYRAHGYRALGYWGLSYEGTRRETTGFESGTATCSPAVALLSHLCAVVSPLQSAKNAVCLVDSCKGWVYLAPGLVLQQGHSCHGPTICTPVRLQDRDFSSKWRLSRIYTWAIYLCVCMATVVRKQKWQEH